MTKDHFMESSDIRLIEDYLPIEAITPRRRVRSPSARDTSRPCISGGHGGRWLRVGQPCTALVPAEGKIKDIDLKNAPADPDVAEAFKNSAGAGSTGPLLQNLSAGCAVIPAIPSPTRTPTLKKQLSRHNHIFWKRTQNA